MTRPQPTPKPCPHPPSRLYAWTAQPGTPWETFCVTCCACGAVLKGGTA